MNGFVYLMKDKDYYKVGHTKRLDVRKEQLQTGNPNEIIIINSYLCKNYKKAEYILHQKYKEYRVINEWFDLPIEIINNFKEDAILADKVAESLKLNPYF